MWFGKKLKDDRKLLLWDKIKLPLMMLLMIIISYLPFNLDFLKIIPLIVLCQVFFFAIFEETRLPYTALIILGMIHDSISGDLIGITSLQYILLTLSVVYNIKSLEKQRFPFIWVSFSLVALLVMVMKYVTLTVWYQTSFFNTSLLLELLFAIMLYPSVHYFCFRKIQWFKRVKLT
jgi:cell shape-determining protein MreD